MPPPPSVSKPSQTRAEICACCGAAACAAAKRQQVAEMHPCRKFVHAGGCGGAMPPPPSVSKPGLTRAEICACCGAAVQPPPSVSKPGRPRAEICMQVRRHMPPPPSVSKPGLLVQKFVHAAVRRHMPPPPSVSKPGHLVPKFVHSCAAAAFAAAAAKRQQAGPLVPKFVHAAVRRHMPPPPSVSKPGHLVPKFVHASGCRRCGGICRRRQASASRATSCRNLCMLRRGGFRRRRQASASGACSCRNLCHSSGAAALACRRRQASALPPAGLRRVPKFVHAARGGFSPPPKRQQAGPARAEICACCGAAAYAAAAKRQQAGPPRAEICACAAAAFAAAAKRQQAGPARAEICACHNNNLQYSLQTRYLHAPPTSHPNTHAADRARRPLF